MPRFSKKPKPTFLGPDEHSTNGMELKQIRLNLMVNWNSRTTCQECVDRQTEQDADALYRLIVNDLPAGTADKLVGKLTKFLALSKFSTSRVNRLAARLHEELQG